MTSLYMLCLVALLQISICETTQVTKIRNVTLLLNQINQIPRCKIENRAQSAKPDASYCDIKLKIRETINGTEMPSLRFQCDRGYLKTYEYRVGFHKAMTINKGAEMNLTIDVYDYDQHNYNPDRFLMTISAPVDLDKDDVIQYRACSTLEKCGDVTGKLLPVTLASNINEVIDEVLHMQFEFSVQSNAVEDGAALPEVAVSQSTPVLYEGTLKLNLISSKLARKTRYLFTVSDNNDAGGNGLIGNQFMLYQPGSLTFEAIYSEQFVSRSELTKVTIMIEDITNQNEKKLITEYTFILQFKSIDGQHMIHNGQDSVDPFVYIQTRGISNRKIYGCKTYTAKFSIVSFNLFNGRVGDEGHRGDPWIRVTAASPTIGTRTIFENHFLAANHAKMKKEDAPLFANGTLIGFPENELNKVTINFLFREDDSSRVREYMPFFGIHYVGKHEMDKDLNDNVTIADFNSSGGECLKYIPEDTTKDDHDLCSLLLFEEEPCTTTSAATTTTAMTTTTTATMVNPLNATDGSNLTKWKKAEENKNKVILAILIIGCAFLVGIMVLEIIFCSRMFQITVEFPWMTTNSAADSNHHEMLTANCDARNKPSVDMLEHSETIV